MRVPRIRKESLSTILTADGHWEAERVGLFLPATSHGTAVSFISSAALQSSLNLQDQFTVSQFQSLRRRRDGNLIAVNQHSGKMKFKSLDRIPPTFFQSISGRCAARKVWK